MYISYAWGTNNVTSPNFLLLPGHVHNSRKSCFFPWVLPLYSPPWIFQEPKGFPKTKETVLFHKSLGGGGKGHSMFCLFPLLVLLQHCYWNGPTGSADWPLLPGCPCLSRFLSSWWSTLDWKSHTFSQFTYICLYVQPLFQSMSSLFWQLGLLASATHFSAHPQKPYGEPAP